jgi:hypothetical protein
VVFDRWVSRANCRTDASDCPVRARRIASSESSSWDSVSEQVEENFRRHISLPEGRASRIDSSLPHSQAWLQDGWRCLRVKVHFERDTERLIFDPGDWHHSNSAFYVISRKKIDPGIDTLPLGTVCFSHLSPLGVLCKVALGSLFSLLPVPRCSRVYGTPCINSKTSSSSILFSLRTVYHRRAISIWHIPRTYCCSHKSSDSFV